VIAYNEINNTQKKKIEEYPLFEWKAEKRHHIHFTQDKEEILSLFLYPSISLVHDLQRNLVEFPPNAPSERTKLEQVLIASQFQQELLEGHHPPEAGPALRWL